MKRDKSVSGFVYTEPAMPRFDSGWRDSTYGTGLHSIFNYPKAYISLSVQVSKVIQDENGRKTLVYFVSNS